jgi:hypothetical protein
MMPIALSKEPTMSESQIKSKARVKERGEVFTADKEVNAMLDLLPIEVFTEADRTFLEPACGTGNFVVKILERKLQYLDPADPQADALRRLASIYAVDIAVDNVVECRQRTLEVLSGLVQLLPAALATAARIVDKNIVVGDFLLGVGKLGFGMWSKADLS